MAYAKRKSESYTNLNGINAKASVYITGESEVLDLQNYDFSTPGAWTKRPGYTQALSGNTFVPGAYSGTSLVQAASLLSQMIEVNDTAAGLRSFYVVANNGFAGFSGSLFSNATLPMLASTKFLSTGLTLYGFGNAVEVDQVTFFTDGQENMYKAVRNASISRIGYFGAPSSFLWDDTVSAGFSLTTGSGSTVGFSGTYFYTYTFEDVLGLESYDTTQFDIFSSYQGPKPPYAPFAPQTNIAPSGFREYIQGAISYSPSLMPLLEAFIPASVNIYRQRISTGSPSLMYRLGSIKWATIVAAYSLATPAIFKDYMRDESWIGSASLAAVPDQGIDYAQELTPITEKGYWWSMNAGNYAFNNATFSQNLPEPYYVGKRARAIQLFNSRLWVLSPDKKIWYSEVGETLDGYETFEPENFIVSNVNSYPLNCAMEFGGTLVVFSQKGVERITGDGPSTFSLTKLTDQYGCVSPRGAVAFRSTMFFVDEQGIIEYNGAGFSKVSDRIEPYMKRMNLSKAFETVTTLHWEDRNEVWFAIPVDNNDVANIVLVYNYLNNAWTTFKTNYDPSMLALKYRTVSKLGLQTATTYSDKRMFLGSRGASMVYFGTEFKTDNGQAITLSFETRNHTEGKSVTQQWRRFYLDTGAWAGITMSFGVQFFSDFATLTPSYTTTMVVGGSEYSGDQQTRIDFGIPAKAWRADVVHSSSSGDVTVHGYTVESRFQRNV